MTAPIAHITCRAALTAAALLVGLIVPAAASAYGWPVAPFDRQHPVRGFFGDPRIGPGSRTLHFGVDISAPDGTQVYATLTGRVVVEPARPEVVAIRSAFEPGVVFAYWHIVPTVRNGSHAVAYRTVIGRIARGWEHVHFAEFRHGRYFNPLRQGALAPYADGTRPEVRSLTAERLGMPLGKAGLAARIDLVAEVADAMPVAAPAPWTGKPVTPALVRWRLVGRRGRVAVPWRTSVDARTTLPLSFDAVYARWTRQNKPWSRGRYRVFLTRNLDTTDLPDGHYAVEIEVADTRGNRSRRAELLVVRNYTPMASNEHAEGEEEEEEEGDASGGLSQSAADARSVVAAFRRQSYRPGQKAELAFWGRYGAVKLELLHSGPEWVKTIGNETMQGVRVAPPRRLVRPRTVEIAVGDWPSGLYVARLTASRGRIGFAPFIVAPRRLGENRIAVVQPTNTWQAYNYRDGDRDGHPDSWYRNGNSRTVSVARPYLDRGVPPHFRQYDLGFIHWLHRRGKQVDMLAQEDVERVSGDRLARLYDLVVFPGHHEYVTEREYDAVERYRDLGGNLAFLSANNFFWRVDRRGNKLHRIAMFRDIGRPEAALVGVQYFDWNHGRYGSKPYRVVGAAYAPWLFAGTGARQGDRFGAFGIEVDGRTAASPRNIRVLARLDNAFGTGRPAEMTYYTTRAGAKVFAAGAFTLAGRQALNPQVSRFLENLWTELRS